MAASIQVDAALASLLLQRHTTTFEAAKDFFRPSLAQLHDPFLMKDMETAVNRFEKAMRDSEKILIYGDYDVDGTTSVSMFYGFLRKKYAHASFYIPDRYSEGYGISYKSIDWAASEGFSLIISLDCGIKSHGQIEAALAKGIDFIVCDHHQPGDSLPAAVAVLDPKRKDCPYPYKELSGCGVGFKLLQALCKSQGWETSELFTYLDLLVISIASDIVPITGENRILASHGLLALNGSCRPGIRALIDVSGFKKKIDISDIVFGLGPRINAAGRIAHAHAAVHLMISETAAEAEKFAEQLNEKNLLRKDVDSSITMEALAMIEEDMALLASKSTVLFKEDWHKGVIGIVASRCIEKYYRPTIIFTESNNMATGSARSVEGFDVYHAISECSDLLEQFGGHMYAAGLTLKKENVSAFRKKFEDIVSGTITEDQLNPRLHIDLRIRLEKIDRKFYNIIRQMAPFGPGNMKPVFVTENLQDDGRARILKESHLKLFVQQDGSQTIEAIGFGMAEKYEGVAAGKKFNLCYTIEENDFNGSKSLQLMIKDLEFI